MTAPLLATFILAAAAADTEHQPRNAWYWHSPVNVHWDNHSRPLGKGMSAEDIAGLFSGLDVGMIQVSARSTPFATYPTKVGVPNPQLEGFDTLATWRDVCRQLGVRFGVYFNVIDDPKLTAQRPEWQRVTAKGERSGLCNRPSGDASAHLETVMLPMVREIVRTYGPDSLWFDGDWQIPKVCHCPNCRAAWKAETGSDSPPAETESPQWADWVRLEHKRLDEYKRQVGEAIHAVDERCMYTSNWSWAISQRDPRTAPAYVDTLSGDVGAGSSRGALYSLRFAALFLSAQEHTPHDIMSAIYPKEVRTLPRMLQEGGLTMASGSSWFLWVNNLTPDQFAHLRTCVGLVDGRRPALGQSRSLNPVAVLLSETAWQHGLTDPGGRFYDWQDPRNWAFALQDAWYGVDVVNEQTLYERIASYRIVVIAEQQTIAPKTLAAIRGFVNRGGRLLVTGTGLQKYAEDPGNTADLLGVTTTPAAGRAPWSLWNDDERIPVARPRHVTVDTAEPVAFFADHDTPALTRKEFTRGDVLYLAIEGLSYPDEDGIALWALRQAGIQPMVTVQGEARDRNLTFSVRHRAPNRTVIHVSDLTTFVDGTRIEPNSSHRIDPVQPIPDLRFRMPCPERPDRVHVYPQSTGLSREWHDGVLDVTLPDFRIHAALVLEGGAASISLLPGAEEYAPPRTYPRPAEILVENFEDAAPGAFPDLSVWAAVTDANTAIRVTDKMAANGTRSLEFRDAANARAPFVPYLVIHPQRLDRGRARFSCELRLQRESVVDIEFRDEGPPQLVGPGIRFAANGTITAGGEDVGKVEHGTWCRVEVEFGLGFERPGFALRVTRGGDVLVDRGDLEYRDTDFRRCTWAGIIGQGTADTAFHLDDIRLVRLGEQ